ncbi:hypothetical protein C8R45DRAFT_630139 [Mycena sanguinolenta]|nr:hypothetical protein C8R45DRAFT_630139 [Mycena sanguinolenta]
MKTSKPRVYSNPPAPSSAGTPPRRTRPRPPPAPARLGRASGVAAKRRLVVGQIRRRVCPARRGRDTTKREAAGAACVLTRGGRAGAREQRGHLGSLVFLLQIFFALGSVCFCCSRLSIPSPLSPSSRHSLVPRPSRLVPLSSLSFQVVQETKKSGSQVAR